MKHYSCTTMIEGPAAAVYDALTTEAGLLGWWTKTCEVGKRVGMDSTFQFGETRNTMRIEKLAPPLEVRWRCVGQHHYAPGQLTRNDEWTDTTLVFRLTSQTPGRTLLEFEHVGLQPELQCYAICEQGWDHFLKRSLKNYIEKGRGEPFAGE